MRQYLGTHILALIPVDANGAIDYRALGFGAIVGGVWNWVVTTIGPTVLDWWHTLPVTAMLTFWTLDMILGTGRAIVRGEWSAREMRKGGGKLALWVFLLWMTYALRGSQVLGAGIFSGAVEAFVIFTDFGSVLVKVGLISDNKDVVMIGKASHNQAGVILDHITHGFQDAAESRQAIAEKQVQVIEEVAEKQVKVIEATHQSLKTGLEVIAEVAAVTTEVLKHNIEANTDGLTHLHEAGTDNAAKANFDRHAIADRATMQGRETNSKITSMQSFIGQIATSSNIQAVEQRHQGDAATKLGLDQAQAQEAMELRLTKIETTKETPAEPQA